MSRSSQDAAVNALTIGDLAEATGVRVATLRAWERRHGFPVPERRPSGHRRYGVDQVAAVRRVVQRREDGVRLEAAIAEVASPQVDDHGKPGARSVYAAVRRRHPGLAPHRLSTSTLVALSWAIEDEFCSRAERANLFGSFQQGSYFRAAHARWEDLALTAKSCTVLADFSGRAAGSVAPPSDDVRALPRRVHLPPAAPLRREWAVVCDADDLPAVLTAWELPGQRDVAYHDRRFEAVWTVDRGASREAARVCADAALDAGEPWAPALVEELREDPGQGEPDLTAMTAMFNRVVAYVDRRHENRADRRH